MSARRGRELSPKWAEGLSLDEIHDEQQARALPLDTDPDTIRDPDVRERFVARLVRVEAGKEAVPRRHRAGVQSGRRRSAPASRGRRRFTHPAHWGGGARGHVVGRPRLRPPASLDSRDWTGFGFGLVLYALVASYLRYGPGGPTQWLKAKFLNDVTLTAAQQHQFAPGPFGTVGPPGPTAPGNPKGSIGPLGPAGAKV